MNWLLYTVLVVAGLLLAVAAIITAYKAFIDKPRDRRKLRSWRLGFNASLIGAGAYILLLLAVVLRLPSDSDKPPDTFFDSVHVSEQRILDSVTALYRCTVDSLSALNQARVTAPEQEASRYAELAIEQAECAAVGEILKTALDSGIYFTSLSEYRQAVTHLNYAIQAAQDDSSKAEAFFNMGVAQHLWAQSSSTSGQLDSAKVQYEYALASYDSALSYKHDYHVAWNDRGTVLYELERHEEAIASFDRALTYKHDYHVAWTNRGAVLIKLERYEEAIASCDSALTYKHDYHMARHNRGFALDKLERYDEAIASYDSALIYKRDFHNTWSSRAFTLEKLDQDQAALASADSALKYKPDYRNAWRIRCIILKNLGRYEEALASCDSALKYKPDYSHAWTSRATVLLSLDSLQEALVSCDSALKYDPTYEEAIVLRQAILEEMNK